MLDIYLPQQPSPLVESPAALVLDVAVGQLTLCHPAALCSVLECFTITCTWLSSPPPPHHAVTASSPGCLYPGCCDAVGPGGHSHGVVPTSLGCWVGMEPMAMYLEFGGCRDPLHLPAFPAMLHPPAPKDPPPQSLQKISL